MDTRLCSKAIFILALLLFMSAPVLAEGERIDWQVISNGGTEADTTAIGLQGTMGQPIVGVSSNAGRTLVHGFWQIFTGGGGEDCCGRYTGGYTGNCNCDIDGKRNLADIATLIDRVYISKNTLCCEVNGDVNGDAEGKINLADIARLIDHVYISKAETVPCT